MIAVFWAAGALFTAAYLGWQDDLRWVLCIPAWPILLGNALRIHHQTTDNGAIPKGAL